MVKSLKIPKARLKFLKAELKLLRLEFRNNPTNFKSWSYTLKVNLLELQIKNLKNSIKISKGLGGGY